MLALLTGLFMDNYYLSAQSNSFSSALKSKKDFIYGIDNRRTHIKDHNALIYGAYVGIGFGGRIKFKFGISGTPFEKGKFVDDQGHIKRNRLIFGTIGEEYDFYIKNKFRLTSYVQFGAGYNYYRIIDSADSEKSRGRNLILPLELGMHANYDVLPWLRAKLGGGWRFVFPEYSSDLSGYYIKIGFSVNTRLLLSQYRNCREKKKTEKLSFNP
ncbi:MAG: hypothetical protein JNM67_10200 [Bacteroidetes bacterium]|nr:hypothetical protein [Bacteroidota bacterium]